MSVFLPTKFLLPLATPAGRRNGDMYAICSDSVTRMDKIFRLGVFPQKCAAHKPISEHTVITFY
jgi:hypothetical protein